MSHQGYSPYQHYVPPPQPQYVRPQFDDDGQYQQSASYGSGPPMTGTHATGASYTTVSSLGTGNSQGAVSHHVSGMGSGHSTGYGAYAGSTQQPEAHHAAELRGPRLVAPMIQDGGPVFEMSGEPAHMGLDKGKGREETNRNDVAAIASSAPEQNSVQANPWPFYLDASPTTNKENSGDLVKEGEQKVNREESVPVQAFPWPYHGPSTEEDEPRATVHPPKKEDVVGKNITNGDIAEEDEKDKPLLPLNEKHGEKPLPPPGKDESVLDDILADMDDQDEEEEQAQRPQRDPTLRPPPLNISRPHSGDAPKFNLASGAASPGGRTYIPYRPAASPTASPTAQSPPQQQPQHVPLVTAPHHVYMPQTQSSLSPPPRPVTSNSPNSASPNSSGGFSPYRPPSPQPPLSASSTGLGIQSQYHGGLGSPTMSGDSAGFVPYQPSTSPRPGRSPAQEHSGLTSPSHPASPAFPPPRLSPSPGPPASPVPGTSPRPSHGAISPVPGLESGSVPPYPPSPPHVAASPGVGRPGPASNQNKPASPAPMAFYPPTTTQQAPSHAAPVPGRLASPPIGASLSRPSSRNDSASIHSGVSSTMGGAPVHPQGQYSRPSPTASGGGTLPSQYFSPQLGPQQQQLPLQSSMPPSPYSIPQQTYASPTVPSLQSPTSPYPPPQPPRPMVTHASTLPSPSPSPLSPPPPYTAVDLPPRPGSQPSTGTSYQEAQSYHQPPPLSQGSQFPPQPTYAPTQSYQQHSQHHQAHPQQQQQEPTLPNLNQSLPPLPPRPSTSHNGRPPPPPRPQGFGSALPNATNFPPPPKPSYNSNNAMPPPPMPPRPPHHQNSYGSSHTNKIFGSQSAKKWLDKTERLVEQTFGDILQPQVDQGRPPAGPGGGGGYHHGPPPQGGYGQPPPQPQYAPSPGHHQQYTPHHRPPQQQGPYPEQGRGRGRR